ncbi:glutathione S-transferase family protein [Roseovarius sp. D22-M7]|uniref:glutathione S-transferase family protein n=1 Tax=Roseovarius sp. D22-M7 TaxID=3127116 RepID=UPI0030100F72
MKLYYAKGTIATAAAITLHEAGLDFEPVRVNFRTAEQTKPDYHVINPKGRVPALVTHQGILTETGAILEYIADIAPEAGLRPADAFAAGQMRAAMYYIASTMHVNHAHGPRGSRWADTEGAIADMKAKVAETMTDSAHHVESHVLTGPYVLGETLSLADPCLYVACGWLEGDGVRVAEFPRITAFLEAMNARPSVARVIADGMA